MLNFIVYWFANKHGIPFGTRNLSPRERDKGTDPLSHPGNTDGTKCDRGRFSLSHFTKRGDGFGRATREGSLCRKVTNSALAIAHHGMVVLRQREPSPVAVVLCRTLKLEL